jgi:hypothetical protein
MIFSYSYDRVLDINQSKSKHHIKEINQNKDKKKRGDTKKLRGGWD